MTLKILEKWVEKEHATMKKWWLRAHQDLIEKKIDLDAQSMQKKSETLLKILDRYEETLRQEHQKVEDAIKAWERLTNNWKVAHAPSEKESEPVLLENHKMKVQRMPVNEEKALRSAILMEAHEKWQAWEMQKAQKQTDQKIMEWVDTWKKIKNPFMKQSVADFFWGEAWLISNNEERKNALDCLETYAKTDKIQFKNKDGIFFNPWSVLNGLDLKKTFASEEEQKEVEDRMRWLVDHRIPLNPCIESRKEKGTFYQWLQSTEHPWIDPESASALQAHENMNTQEQEQEKIKNFKDLWAGDEIHGWEWDRHLDWESWKSVANERNQSGYNKYKEESKINKQWNEIKSIIETASKKKDQKKEGQAVDPLQQKENLFMKSIRRGQLDQAEFVFKMEPLQDALIQRALSLGALRYEWSDNQYPKNAVFETPLNVEGVAFVDRQEKSPEMPKLKAMEIQKSMVSGKGEDLVHVLEIDSDIWKNPLKAWGVSDEIFLSHWAQLQEKTPVARLKLGSGWNPFWTWKQKESNGMWREMTYKEVYDEVPSDQIDSFHAFNQNMYNAHYGLAADTWKKVVISSIERWVKSPPSSLESWAQELNQCLTWIMSDQQREQGVRWGEKIKFHDQQKDKVQWKNYLLEARSWDEVVEFIAQEWMVRWMKKRDKKEMQELGEDWDRGLEFWLKVMRGLDGPDCLKNKNYDLNDQGADQQEWKKHDDVKLRSEQWIQKQYNQCLEKELEVAQEASNKLEKNKNEMTSQRNHYSQEALKKQSHEIKKTFSKKRNAWAMMAQYFKVLLESEGETFNEDQWNQIKAEKGEAPKSMRIKRL